jgi:adenylate cyclase
MEIERKFLLERLPEGLPEGEPIRQGYLAIAPDGVEVRVRDRAGKATLTIKSGPAHVRTEEELEIDGGRFEALWPLTEGRRIVKTRHVLDIGNGAEAEIDVYEDGLLVAEVEFPDEETSRAFVLPDWLGEEVTGDRRYANQALAVDGPP